MLKIMPRSNQKTMTQIANQYSLLALLTLARWTSPSPHNPSGHSAERKGGGLGTPCNCRAREIGRSLARLAVPQGKPRCTANNCLESNISQRMASPDSVVRSSWIIGTTGSCPSWSTLKTEKPACNAARESDPRPAKSSTKSGVVDPCTCETYSSTIQSA